MTAYCGMGWKLEKNGTHQGKIRMRHIKLCFFAVFAAIFLASAKEAKPATPKIIIDGDVSEWPKDVNAVADANYL